MKKLVLTCCFVLAACGGSAGQAESADGLAGSDEDSGLMPPTSVAVSDIDSNHVDPPVSFDQSPSIGGDHYPFWQNCGFYEVELIEGAAAHTMEHGAIWITYNPGQLSEAELSTLAGMAEDNDRLLISPYPHDEPLVVSGWGVQQRGITSVASPDLDGFITQWADNPDLPEAGVRCTGAAGIPPDDVRSLADGAQVPEDYR